VDLAKLRVYLTHERTTAEMTPVLVITDGAERIVIRADSNPGWQQIGAGRLVTGAMELAAAVDERVKL
jgi:hypothetical protein